MIEAHEIEKSYSEKVLFRDSSFVIQRGDRIGLFGENGCGKTTLIKAIMGEMKLDAGEIVVSASAQLGVMTQDVLDLPETVTVMEIFEKGTKTDEYEVRTLLANLGVGAGKLMKKIGQLSLGERVRIKLTKVILSPNIFCFWTSLAITWIYPAEKCWKRHWMPIPERLYWHRMTDICWNDYATNC